MSNDETLIKLMKLLLERSEALEEMMRQFVDLSPSNGEQLPNYKIGTIPVGSHIAKECDGSIVFHHGIFIGSHADDYRIIHFTGDTKDNAVITEGTFGDFIGTANTFYLINYTDDTVLNRERTVAVAEFLHKHLHRTEGIYDAFSSNCECFATYCRTGKMRSLSDIKFLFYTPTATQKNVLTNHFWTGLS